VLAPGPEFGRRQRLVALDRDGAAAIDSLPLADQAPARRLQGLFGLLDGGLVGVVVVPGVEDDPQVRVAEGGAGAQVVGVVAPQFVFEDDDVAVVAFQDAAVGAEPGGEVACGHDGYSFECR
jgi:hypothetical protein